MFIYINLEIQIKNHSHANIFTKNYVEYSSGTHEQSLFKTNLVILTLKKY